MILKDQRGIKVNTDNLVLLPYNHTPLPGFQFEDVLLRAEWFEVNGILMASTIEIGDYSEDNPIDAGIKFTEETEILYINNNLKRYNDQDGFYHV